MESKECVLCSKEVCGTVESVPVTFCCTACCQKASLSHNERYRGKCRVSKTVAMSQYGCEHEDLMQLNFQAVPNPVKWGGPPMKLYLRAEVEHLGTLRQKMLRAQEQERECGALIGKKIALESSLGVRLSSMDRVLRHFLLGDFLKKSTGTKTSWKDVEKRFGVLDRVKEIMETCEGAHPAAAFEYCLEYPDGTPDDFQRLKQKIRDVFYLEGTRILYQVPWNERKELKNTPLKDVYHEFLTRDENKDKLVYQHLLKWFNEQTATELMEHRACQYRQQCEGEEYGIAKKLMEFWLEKDNKALRTQRLTSALKAKNLSMPNDCQFCQQYVNGDIDCDVEEVVGCVAVNTQLGIRHNGWSPIAAVVQSAFRECRHELKYDYEDALSGALAAGLAAREAQISSLCIIDDGDYSEGLTAFSDDMSVYSFFSDTGLGDFSDVDIFW